MSTPAALPAHRPLAAIDLGSNSFRLEIAHLRHGRYSRVHYAKEFVRLGAGLAEDGTLTADAVARGLHTLRGFRADLETHAPAALRVVATQTLREARNRDAFLRLAEEALGHPVEVISGREEARLIYAGVAHLHPSEAPRLVIDIGGRSTELVLGQGLQPGDAESFGIGSQSLTQRYFPDGRLTAEAFRQAQIAAGAEFEEALSTFRGERWSEALASSGTAASVSALLGAQGLTDGRLTPASLAWCIERCIEAGHIDRVSLHGLKDERRPVLAGGLAILYTLMTLFGIRELQPAKAALRQGVIFDLHQRRQALRSAEPADLRDQSVAELQQRFRVDTGQARRVRAVALQLQQDLLPELPAEAARELGWACDLHELGLMVSHHDHHRHSAYLLGHVDAPGFSQSLQRRLADLVLGQRGGLRKVEAACSRQGFRIQLLCLRLAVIACHRRDADAPARLDAQLTAERNGVDDVRLRVAPELDRRGRVLRSAAPDLRTVHLLEEEMSTWRKAGMLTLRWDDADAEASGGVKAA